MTVPTRHNCFKLIARMGMLDHIVLHSLTVCHVATTLTDLLLHNGWKLDRDLVLAAAMLHDITKTRSFETGENHAQTGGTLLEQMGYENVGSIVAQHVCLETYATPLKIGEVQIVNYADKRVLHDQIVSLEKRKNYIVERYGHMPEAANKIEWVWRETIKIETALFDAIGHAPDHLIDLLQPEKLHLDYSNYCQRYRPAGMRVPPSPKARCNRSALF
jgi:putative nucleotidyltransferase with HDIG domain